jgi:hypothetical protein
MLAFIVAAASAETTLQNGITQTDDLAVGQVKTYKLILASRHTTCTRRPQAQTGLHL